MPAVSGEPFRACAQIEIRTAAAMEQRFTVYCDAGFPVASPGDNTTWEAAPGATLTLRAMWNNVGSQAATRFDVTLRLPGGGAVGSTWNVPLSDGVEQTRTIRIDSDPIANSAANAIRAGTLEVHIEIQSTGGVDPWGPWDSRGRQDDPPALASAADSRWARGYIRARSTLSALSRSNVSLGGASPSTFAYPDTIFERATLGAVLYESKQLTHKLRQSGADVRSDVDDSAHTGTARDCTFDANSGLGARVNGGFANGSASGRLVMPTDNFGGDLNYEWAASGHLTGWAPNGNGILDGPSNFTVNPSLTFTKHIQHNDNTFAVAKNDATAQRLSADLSFVAARVLNARSEGVNLPGSETGAGAIRFQFGDDGNLTTDKEFSPVWRATTTQDGQAGWSPLLSWSESLPGGGWTNAVTVQDAAGSQGTASHTFTLLAADPRIKVRGQINKTARPDAHLHAADQVRITCEVLNVDTGVRLTPDTGTVKCALLRYNSATGRREYLDSSEAWNEWDPTEALHYFDMTASAGDARLFERTFTTTATWTRDIAVEFKAKVVSTPYEGTTAREVTGAKNPHDRNDFDPTGLFK